MNVVEKIESVGVKVNPYKRGPAGKDPFIISRDSDKIRIWPGNSEITVSTDKRNRQALLKVKENARDVKANGSIYLGYSQTEALVDKTSNEILKALTEAYSVSNKSLDKRLKECAHTFVPNSTVKSVSNFRVQGGYIYYEIVLRAKSTRSSFLVGYDESESKYPFICQLRTNKADNPLEARKALRPEGLSTSAKRQGEWFFDPAPNSIQNELNRNIQNIRTGVRLSDTSHYANVLSYKGESYVIGKVSERYRRGHHKPLVLNRWHRVVRNKEVQVADSASWD